MKKSLISTVVAGAAAAVLALTPAAATAQSASITASATVATALTVTNLRNLGFGTVIPGFNRTINATDATSGHFSLAGGANAEVAISFSALPSLTGPGTAMAVAYTATYNTSDAGGSGTSFTPSSGVTTRLDSTTGGLHVYLGGTLTVPAGQTPGSYSGTVTMDAAYTGN